MRHNAIQLGICALTATVALTLLHLQERQLSRWVAHRFGWRALYITAWLGVPCHEFAHLVTARLFGHRIVDWRLFAPDPSSGTLGYVRHGHSCPSIIQKCGYFAIGIAPAISGTIALGFVLRWAVGPEHLANWISGMDSRSVFGTFVASLPELSFVAWNRHGWWLFGILYVAVAIAVHMAPSASDLQRAGSGLFALFLALTAVATACAAVNFRISSTSILIVLAFAYLVGSMFQLAYLLIALCFRALA